MTPKKNRAHDPEDDGARKYDTATRGTNYDNSVSGETNDTINYGYPTILINPSGYDHHGTISGVETKKNHNLTEPTDDTTYEASEVY